MTSEEELWPLAILCRRDCVLLAQTDLTNVRAILQFGRIHIVEVKVKCICNLQVGYGIGIWEGVWGWPQTSWDRSGDGYCLCTYCLPEAGHTTQEADIPISFTMPSSPSHSSLSVLTLQSSAKQNTEFGLYCFFLSSCRNFFLLPSILILWAPRLGCQLFSDTDFQYYTFNVISRFKIKWSVFLQDSLCSPRC